MSTIPSIDLHPEKLPGKGPETALLACRSFLEQCLAAGRREARIVTGLGLHGDGTPRLRKRVESEVLSGFASRIEQQSYEQSGAVIHLWFTQQAQAPSGAWKRQQHRQMERSAVAVREERLMVAFDRVDAAAEALDEGDLRRFRLKLNQVSKAFGWPVLDKLPDLDEAQNALKIVEEALKKADR